MIRVIPPRKAEVFTLTLPRSTRPALTRIDPRRSDSVKAVRDDVIATIRWGSRHGKLGYSTIAEASHDTAKKTSVREITAII